MKSFPKYDILNLGEKASAKSEENQLRNLSEIDKNFAVVRAAGKEDALFHNALEKPFEIDGVFYEEGKFRRIPERVAKQISDGVYALHANTAGGRVRFSTDSPYVVVSAKMTNIGKMPHFTLCGSAGFDLYSGKTYVATLVPPYEMTDGYESVAELGDKKWREITINFPLYSDVEELYIGISGSAKIKPPKPYKNKKPVVYYGSSITQGGCASRPGNAYPTILSRELNLDFVNLGFSGSAKAEKEAEEYIKGLPMSAFIYDYDHNAPTMSHLADTHARMFKAVREANPTLPIVLLSRPQHRLDEEAKGRLAIIQKTYAEAVQKGDKNVYLIEGNKLMSYAKDEGTVDGCHPNDLGFYSMAKALKKVLKQIVD